ncbi:hypothetical protein TNCV_1281291 [Trichonephila clavipes]|nr:hypothetical protein TNCV_1281291 [Trichonephila clavipes]
MSQVNVYGIWQNHLIMIKLLCNTVANSLFSMAVPAILVAVGNESLDAGLKLKAIRPNSGNIQLRGVSEIRIQILVPLPTATAGSDVVQSGRPIFDDFFQHLWPYIGNNTANGVFQMVKRLWLIRIDQ